MTDAYYDPHPLLSLEVPLALVGHPGAGVSTVGRVICGRTGLPFNDVERSTEAMAGCSRSSLVLGRGTAGLYEVEADALRKAVQRRPCGVVVLGSGLLEHEDLHAWLDARCRLVYVRRPDAVLLERLRRQLADAPGSVPEFMAGTPANAEQLRDFLAPREQRARRIDVVFEAGDQHPSQVAGEILAALDRLLPVRSLDA